MFAPPAPPVLTDVRDPAVRTIPDRAHPATVGGPHNAVAGVARARSTVETSMAWIKPEFEIVELCSEVTSYRYHR